VEKLARYVDNEEKIWVKLIVSAHVLERISQVASTAGQLLKTAKKADVRSCQFWLIALARPASRI